MRLAVFADIHGNLEALHCFLDSVGQYDIDRYLFLGDIVGYGSNPNECIESITQLPQLSMILGNHDAATFWHASPYEMNIHAQKALFWTMNELTERNLSLLQTLQLNLNINDMSFTHATPFYPGSWAYLNNFKKAFLAFTFSKHRLNFVSHTHTPQLICQESLYNLRFERPRIDHVYRLNKDKRWIINCGSIGQPRDGSPDSCYCIYDTNEQILVYQKIQYDVLKTVGKMKAAGLPDSLNRRLLLGK